MNNHLGSFDDFAFSEELVQPETDIETSSDTESNCEAPFPTTLTKTTGPSIKNSILCQEEFVPMTKPLVAAQNLESPSTSNAPAKPTAPKNPKKRPARKNPATSARGKARIAKSNAPQEAGGKEAPTGASSKEEEIGHDKEFSIQPAQAPQPQPRIAKRKRTPKKSKKREFLLELMELVENYSTN